MNLRRIDHNPDKYYTEGDPEKRLAILEKQTAESGDTDETRMKRELWNYRYEKNKHMEGYADRFLVAATDLYYLYQDRQKRFRAKANRRALDKAMKVLFPEQYPQELVEAEHRHLVALYIYLSGQNKRHTTRILGIGKISREEKRMRIEEDLNCMFKGIAESFEGAERLLKIAEMADAAVENYFDESQD